MNKAKNLSDKKGYDYLKSAFIAEEKVLLAQLEQAKTITHDGTLGKVTENLFIKILKKYLPKRYKVTGAIIIDSNGEISDQIDIVIYDNQYTNTLLDQSGNIYIPCEAVYGIFEVKQQVNKKSLGYTAKKVESVRRLNRTSVEIYHAGGKHPPKKHFTILGGLIAYEAEWKDGLDSKSFKNAFSAFEGDKKVDCCLAISPKGREVEKTAKGVIKSGSFDIYDEAPCFVKKEPILIHFIFRLLYKLQNLGTVSAIDWCKYLKFLEK